MFAVFTLGKLMNVNEDYGELSSIARSVTDTLSSGTLFVFYLVCDVCLII
jgi:hypothetical protein